MKLHLLNRYHFRPHIAFDVEPKSDGAMQITGLNADPSECVLTENVPDQVAPFAATFPVSVDVNIYVSAHIHHTLYDLGVCKYTSELILRNRITAHLRVYSLNF